MNLARIGRLGYGERAITLECDLTRVIDVRRHQR